MGRKLADMRAAGAVQAIAMQFRRCNCWDQTTQWAGREFRDCSKQTIKACVERAKKAVNLADRMMAADPEHEFDAAAERKLQA